MRGRSFTSTADANVGKAGLARWTLRGRHDAEPSLEILRFDQACELRAEQTNVHVNGIYTGTAFDFDWIEPSGQILWRIKGEYDRRKGEMPEGDPWRFAQAAESAWSKHFTRVAAQQLSDKGSISFRIDGERLLRVGPGFVEFDFRGTN